MDRESVTVVLKSGLGSAIVPIALAGVSPGSLVRIGLRTIGEHRGGLQRVFGETPKTAIETIALPKPLNRPTKSHPLLVNTQV